jgi:WD40 repeat protein
MKTDAQFSPSVLINNTSYQFGNLDNTFTVFESVNKEIILIYGTEKNKIFCYNLNKQKKEELGCNQKPDKYIIGFRHYSDKAYNRDLIMCLTSEENSIRVWDLTKLNEPICYLRKISPMGKVHSACFLQENNIVYICIGTETKKIQVFDLNGKKTKEFEGIPEQINFIDTYQDNGNVYIVTGCNGYTRSFDYNKKKVFQKYYDKDSKNVVSVIVYKDNNVIKLVESENHYGIIRIYLFNEGTLLKKIEIKNKTNGICLLNEKVLLVGCDDGKIRFVDMEQGTITRELNIHKAQVSTIQKINFSGGNFLFSQAFNENIAKWDESTK